MCIKMKPEVSSKGTCVFVSSSENAEQFKQVYKKKCIDFGETKSSLRKGNNDIKVEICEYQLTN